MELTELEKLLNLLKNSGVSRFKTKDLELELQIGYNLNKDFKTFLESFEDSKSSEPKLIFEMNPEELPE